jgi:mono/diheme cytochrome c family protein
MPFTPFLHTHKLVVTLFILIYLIKAILLLMNGNSFDKFIKFIRIPEMIISALFFITGLYMLTQIADFTTLFAIKLSFVVIVLPLAIFAYKKRNKLLAIITVLVLITVYGLAEMHKAQFAKKVELTETVVVDDDENYDRVAHGKALYEVQCIVCHGEDGKAQRSGAKDITITTLSDEEIIAVIKNGKNTMPAMGAIFDERELNALVAYIKTL